MANMERLAVYLKAAVAVFAIAAVAGVVVVWGGGVVHRWNDTRVCRPASDYDRCVGLRRTYRSGGFGLYQTAADRAGRFCGRSWDYYVGGRTTGQPFLEQYGVTTALDPEGGADEERFMAACVPILERQFVGD